MRPSQARNIAKCTETPNLIVPRFVLGSYFHKGSLALTRNRRKLVKAVDGSNKSFVRPFSEVEWGGFDTSFPHR